jgi:CRM1 / Exportin repeat 2
MGMTQVFKITLEYWNFFVPDVYSSVSTLDVNAPFAFGGPVAPSNRKALYAAVLSRLRLLMISRMAKPEEVGFHRPYRYICRRPCHQNHPAETLQTLDYCGTLFGG